MHPQQREREKKQNEMKCFLKENPKEQNKRHFDLQKSNIRLDKKQ